MNTFETNDKTITLIYNVDTDLGKKTRAASVASGLKLREIDILKDGLTANQILNIAHGFGMNVRELINKESDGYEDEIRGKEFDNGDMVNLLSRNPGWLKSPILIHGRDYHHIKDINDVAKYLPTTT